MDGFRKDCSGDHAAVATPGEAALRCRVTANELPAEVRHLIARHLASMEQVDVLLLLARAPEQWQSGADISRSLRIDEKGVAARTFEELRDARLIEMDGAHPPRYRYAPANAGDKAAVEMLAVAYNERPVTLVRAIYARPTAAQSFADAFRLRKKTEE
jgi:hypothetical protein